MTLTARIAIAAALMAAPLAPHAFSANDQVAPRMDVAKSDPAPKHIPHAVKGRQAGADCLVCHEKGINKAPVTSHPDRIACTNCHTAGS